MENNSISTPRRTQKAQYQTIESTLGVAGKLTPQSLDFETAVLGAILISAGSAGDVLDFLKPFMFYKEAHQHIYSAISKLFEKTEPVDLLTVTDALRKSKQLELVGGVGYLASLTNRVASAANIEYHARIVMEKYVLRELIVSCDDIQKRAYDESTDVFDLMDHAESSLFGIIQQNFKRDSKELGIVVKKALEELDEMRKKDSSVVGVPTGIRCVDEKIGGWQKSDLVIIAARPGMGKTSFVLSIARNAAIDFDKPVAFFSLEMGATQIVNRLFSMESGIDSHKITKAALSDDEWTHLVNKIGNLSTQNLIIDDTAALSVFDLRAKCRRLKSQYDIQLVIVDYLQLMQANSDSEKGKGNREQEISYISRSLKAMAKDLDVPVIALSQLSRAVETRGTGGAHKRPQLSDLRESGSIEQDADMVMFIYRPEYYGFESFEDETTSKGYADLIISKNRHGATEDIRVKFIKQYTKFCDVNEGLEHFSGNADSFAPSAGMAPNSAFVLESKMNNEDVLTSKGFDLGEFPSITDANIDPTSDIPF